MSERAHVP